MKPNECLGLVKFFRNETYLDKLISGTFHCQTPETYRLHEMEGVSDKFESCTFSYRKTRNDPSVPIKINGIELHNLLEMTVHNADEGDSWLNCWLLLRMPADENELESLKKDIALMKKQFGVHYAYISPPNLSKVLEILRKNSEKTLYRGEVRYCEDKNEWGIFCKSPSYAYQREYRFAFGSCSPSETEAYCFNCPEGFHDLICKNPEIQIEVTRPNRVWFDL